MHPGSIAEKCLLKVGDVLLAVNDVSVMDATHQEVVKLMSQGNDTNYPKLTKCPLILKIYKGLDLEGISYWKSNYLFYTSRFRQSTASSCC